MLYFSRNKKNLFRCLEKIQGNTKRYIYLRDNTKFRAPKELFFYAFIKWKIENFKNIDHIGVEEDIEYVLPDLRYEFKYLKNHWWFFPQFRIHYKNIVTPELISFDKLNAKKANAYRVLQHKFPDIVIRLVEPVETDNYRKFMKNQLVEDEDYKIIKQTR